jgi:NAD(P)-dependent dehydrogenase (short-subunit alcohol dehydrogenase family)
MSGKQRAQGVAVVTGAAGGMGSATARRLAADGWPELLLCDVSEERLEAVAAPLRSQGAKVEVLAGDVADPAFPAQVVAALAGRPVAALVHTAGLAPGQAPPERILAVNLDGTARLVDALRESMAPGSAAVLYASNSSYFPMPPELADMFSQPLPPEGTAALAHLAPTPELAYPLSKIGVRALVRREAKAFGARGARLVSISPGVIDTPMTRQGGISESPAVKHMVAGSGAGRMGNADELAAVSAFLCSPDASFVTGVDWLVDGGHTAAMGF